jgi:hypothetical protein
MEYLQRSGLFPEGDPAVVAAIDAGHTARHTLNAARATLLRTQQEQARAEDAVATAQAASDREWRRVWAEAHHPELIDQLSTAQSDEAKLRANEYVGTSSRGMGDLRFARARIVAVEAALGRVAKQAPCLGTDVTLPADWDVLTPEQKRDWVLRVDQLATLAAG